MLNQPSAPKTSSGPPRWMLPREAVDTFVFGGKSGVVPARQPRPCTSPPPPQDRGRLFVPARRGRSRRSVAAYRSHRFPTDFPIFGQPQVNPGSAPNHRPRTDCFRTCFPSRWLVRSGSGGKSIDVWLRIEARVSSIRRRKSLPRVASGSARPTNRRAGISRSAAFAVPARSRGWRNECGFAFF